MIWLKNKLAADHLLQAGAPIFGATGAYCSKWERREDTLPCFNCNRYGHKQASCRVPPKCALCSGKHLRRDCPRPTDLKCPACDKEGHCVFDWQCQLNPSHWKYKGIQKAGKASQRGQTAVAATPSRNTPTRGECNTIVEASQGQEHQKQASITKTTDEREVDMTDVAETLSVLI